MGNSSVQITHPSWITQETKELDLAECELGNLVEPGRGSAASNPAHRPATHALSGDAVREVPASLSMPGERVGASKPDRCIPLSASAVEFPAGKPRYVCMSVASVLSCRVHPIPHCLIGLQSLHHRCLPL